MVKCNADTILPYRPPVSPESGRRAFLCRVAATSLVLAQAVGLAAVILLLNERKRSSAYHIIDYLEWGGLLAIGGCFVALVLSNRQKRIMFILLAVSILLAIVPWFVPRLNY